jgi:hypothetical protein
MKTHSVVAAYFGHTWASCIQYQKYMTRVSYTHERTQRRRGAQVMEKRANILKLLNVRKMTTYISK